MTFRCSEDFKADLDLLRKDEHDLPSRTGMLHRLVTDAAARVKALNGRAQSRKRER